MVIILIVVICLLLIFFTFLITLLISGYVGHKLIHPARREIVETPDNYKLEYEKISFNSSYDGINLKGWWIPAQDANGLMESKDTVIFGHGYKNARDLYSIHVLALAERLAKEGYNVLLFDFRNAGESDGNVTSVGLFETFDMLSAIDYAKTNKESNCISLLGWSMGAAVSIMAGAESNDVSKIIADSPFSDLNNYLRTNLPVWSGLPSFPFTFEIMNFLPKVFGDSIFKISPENSVKKLGDKELLLIHSKGDTAIPYENSVKIYENVQNKKNVQLWLTEKAKHIKSYDLYKMEYEDKIVQFLKGN